MLSIKNLANIITATRLVCAVILLFSAPFSMLFWGLYLYCGISDFVDGLVARAMKQQSELGAKLDSVADVVFFLVILIAVIRLIPIPIWMWVCAILSALIRVTAFLIGYMKYQTFSALHTYANKITGGLLFGAPILFTWMGITVVGIALCILALFSAGEELLITVRSKHLDRNCRSIFSRTALR